MASDNLSPWMSKRSDNLNRFYTRGCIHDVLLDALEDIAPRSMIDLGAGEGSLSLAVMQRWPDVCVDTVDVDQACVLQLQARLAAAGVRSHRHAACDALSVDLPSMLSNRQFDLGVCNPPFFRPAWDRSYADILRDADFGAACPNPTDVTAEILFFAQNLRLVRDGGTIALIVPDGLATGARARAFRTAVMTQHTLIATVQLPPYSFSDTEAYCFILVVKKERSKVGHRVKLTRLDEEGAVSEPLWVDSAAAEIRLDYSYHHTMEMPVESAFTLRDLGAEIRRGSINSVQRRAANFPVFHTGDFSGSNQVVTSIEDFASSLVPSKTVIAEAGDILMARVDRALHQKITYVASGKTAITDCLYRIRLPEEHQLRAFRAMTSAAGRRRIQAATKGVGARLIGKGDLLDLPFSDSA